jgi:hypothetical protein
MNQPAIDRRTSGDHSIGWQILICHAKVSGTMLGESAYFLEAVWIYELFDPLARAEQSRGMMFFAVCRRPA